jgi:peptidoglycan-associated lipoprotein
MRSVIPPVSSAPKVKGGVMRTRVPQVLVVFVISLVVALAGCAKRPATTQAAAPAPTGTGQSTASGQQPGQSATSSPSTPSTGGGSGAGETPRGPAPAVATPGERPRVQEFTAVPDLKDIFYDFDRYDVRPEDAKTLDSNAQWLKSNPNHLVLIEGHCDERGTNEYNLALGERRAKAAMNYLVSQGVQASRITIISYGEERPQCSERSDSCWAKNRRAHFLVKPR